MRTTLSALVAAGLLLATPWVHADKPAAGVARVTDKVYAIAQSSDGARVLLYADAGPCVGAARLAEHVSPEGEKTPGCWVVYQDTVMVSFLDGERGNIPVAQLKRLAES
jgi:hypothetical protein